MLVGHCLFRVVILCRYSALKYCSSIISEPSPGLLCDVQAPGHRRRGAPIKSEPARSALGQIIMMMMMMMLMVTISSRRNIV